MAPSTPLIHPVSGISNRVERFAIFQRADAHDFLKIAEEIHPRPKVTVYPLESMHWPRSSAMRWMAGRDHDLTAYLPPALYHSRMRTRIPHLAFLLGSSLLLLAQAPMPPIDNDQAHVTVAHDLPHKKGAPHQHKLDRVMIYMQAGRQEFVQDGKKTIMTFKAGDVKWSPATRMHTSEIVSDNPVTIVEVEVKKPGDPAKAVNTPLDPLKVDPQDYKLEFENAKVRVIRVKMPAGRKVPLHQHTLNRVVVDLTDQNGSMTTPDGQTTTAQHKPGDYSWGTPVTHMEQNHMDHPFEAIIVEFKS